MKAWNYKDLEPEPKRKASRRESAHTRLVTTSLSLILFLAISIPIVWPGNQESYTNVLGDTILNLPTIPVLLFIAAIFFVPVPYIVFHIVRVILYNSDIDRPTRGIFSFFFNLAYSWRDSELRFSVLISTIGIVYMLAIPVAWNVLAKLNQT